MQPVPAYRYRSMIQSPKVGSAAELLAAADAVANRTAELMGEAKPAGDVVPLRAR